MSGLNAEVEIARLVSRTKLRKEEAKDCRDEGDIEGAIRALKNAVETLEASPLAVELEVIGEASQPVKTLAFHLADCIGMLGGNFRRLNRLDEAQACFERGRVYEESPALDVMSSYNLVNAITLPLETGTRQLAEQTNALSQAVTAIDRQVKGDRRNDRWGWADLAQCQLLLNARDDALRSYRRARDLGDEETVTSMVSVLKRLHAMLRATEIETANRIEDTIRALSA